MTNELPEAEANSAREGHYANYFKIGHNAFEFLLEFGQLYHEKGSARLHTRIIVAPIYAKRLYELLQDSLTKYEQAFGNILHDEPGNNFETGKSSVTEGS